MKFILQLPSLEQMTLVKIVVTLWNQNDVRDLIAKLGALDSCDRYAECNRIGDRVIEKVSQLLLPQPLKEKVLDIIIPIGLEISEWVRFHHESYFRVDLPAALDWTPQGTIDRRRTAEGLVGDQSLDIATRYKLACVYCFEETIKKLWCEVPEDIRQSFSQRGDLDEYCWENVVFLWTRNMERGGWDNAHTSYKMTFLLCANEGIQSAAEYFLRKLTPREREEALIRSAKHNMSFAETDKDVLCFLLSQIDEEQQINQLFRFYPDGVLRSFLRWPLQSFIEKADHLWDTISKRNYRSLLIAIIDRVNDGYRDWNYKKLFRFFWQKSSINIYELDIYYPKPILCEIKEKEFLRLILKEATVAEKKKFISNVNAHRYYYRLMCDDRWDLLECFIEECSPSEDEKMKFKEEFEKSIMKKYKIWSVEMQREIMNNVYMPMIGYGYKVVNRFVENKQKWDQLFCLSDVCRNKKRTVEVGESSSSKQLRCKQ